MSLLSWSTPDLGASYENLPPYVVVYNLICYVLKMTSFNSLNDDIDRYEIESQRLSLAKEKENFEREQEAFEKRRKTLEEAQARLESERRNMEREHAAQVRIN